MSKPLLSVALVIGEGAEGEANAIRFALEYFGAKVTPFFIGRPSDFISILNGEWLYKDMSHLILCFHGKAGKFVMQRLGKDVYEADEPRGNFGAAEIAKVAKLKGKIVVSTGCTLGRKDLAKSFLATGAKAYIGADGYIEGNSALFFVMRFYYEILTYGRSLKEAFNISSTTDKDTKSFKLYLK